MGAREAPARDAADLEALRALGLYFEAQRAIRAREQLLAMVSHDLRNSLTSISMFAALLRADERDPGAAMQLDLILHAADRMKRLITSAIQGLYICRGIIEAHGGRIRADSRPGEGTRISFTLPLAAPG